MKFNCFAYYPGLTPNTDCKILTESEGLRMKHLGFCNSELCPYFKEKGKEHIMRADKESIDKVYYEVVDKTFYRHGYLEAPMTLKVIRERGKKRRTILK